MVVALQNNNNPMKTIVLDTNLNTNTHSFLWQIEDYRSAVQLIRIIKTFEITVMRELPINLFRFRQFSHYYSIKNGFNDGILISLNLISYIICSMPILS